MNTASLLHVPDICWYLADPRTRNACWRLWWQRRQRTPDRLREALRGVEAAQGGVVVPVPEVLRGLLVQALDLRVYRSARPRG